MLFAWQKIVFQNFYGAHLRFSYFLLHRKVLCFALVSESLEKCLFPKALWKNYISALGDIIEVIIEALRYLTQIVHSNSKMLFLEPYYCLSKFLRRAAHFSYFLLQGKILFFASVGKSLARCLFPKRSESLVEKLYLCLRRYNWGFEVFNSNCSFKK